MSVINWPLLYIADPDKGRPLFAGQIFVGIADLDPEIPANQKDLSVIQEDGTVVPIPQQPFILSAGGVPTYNGNPVRLSVDGNYSIKILNKLGAQTYYIENVFEGQPITEEELPGLLINDLSQAYEPWENVAAMEADTTILPIGKKVFWQGYYIQSDGGSNWGIVKSGVHTPDGGSIFTLADGKYVEANLKGSILNARKFGAINDFDGGLNPSPTENGVKINAALNYIDEKTALKITGSGYWYDQQINLDARKIIGDGVIIKDLSLQYGIYMTGDDATVEGLTFTPLGASPDSYTDIKFAEGSVRPKVINCTFLDFVYSGTAYNAIIGSDFGAENIYTNKVIRPLIDGCVFVGYQRPIYLNSMYSPRFTNNDVSFSIRDGLRTIYNSGHIVIDSCIFERCGDGAPVGQTADAIDSNVSGEWLSITNCKFLYTKVIAIDVKGFSDLPPETFTGKSSKILISGNEITGSGLAGISAYSVDDIAGTDFTEWPYNYDLAISDNIITKTRYDEAGDDTGAIWIKSGFKGVLIDDNLITSNNCRAIYIQKDPDDPVNEARVRYVVISNNIIFNNYNYGAHLTDVINLTIVGNQFGNDESFAEDDQVNEQGIGLKILTTDAAAVGKTTIVKNNQFPGNLSAPYQVDDFNVIRAWSDNVWDEVTGAISANEMRVMAPSGTLLFGNGVVPSGALGDYEGDLVYNASKTKVVGDFLFYVKLGNGSWGKTGEIVAV